MTVKQLLSLDIRKEEEFIIIQKALKTIKPLSKESGIISIDKIERVVKVMCVKYGYAITNIISDIESGEKDIIWTASITDAKERKSISTIHGCVFYEVISKIAIFLYGEIQRKRKDNVVEQVRVFTDGACSGNPGPGGWAAIFVIGNEQRILKGRELDTTNNRMELAAIVASLRKIKVLRKRENREYIINSDSAYVINAINQNWIAKWIKNDWETSKGEKVKNCDLWEECNKLINEINEIGVKILYCKVKGHSGNPLNEYADQIAKTEAAKAFKQ